MSAAQIPGSLLELRSRIIAFAGKGEGLPCASAVNLLDYARLAAAPPDTAAFAAHLLNCPTCAQRWTTIQNDDHVRPGEMLAMVRGLVSTSDDARFFELRAQGHIDRCSECQGAWSVTRGIFEIAPGATTSVHVEDLVERLRRAAGPVSRSSDGGRVTVSATVLQSDRTLAIHDGAPRNAEVLLRSAHIGADGSMLVLLDLADDDRAKFRAMQVAVQTEDRAVLLPEVAGDGQFRVEMKASATLKGRAVEIAPENLWIWLRE